MGTQCLTLLARLMLMMAGRRPFIRPLQREPRSGTQVWPDSVHSKAWTIPIFRNVGQSIAGRVGRPRSATPREWHNHILCCVGGMLFDASLVASWLGVPQRYVAHKIPLPMTVAGGGGDV